MPELTEEQLSQEVEIKINGQTRKMPLSKILEHVQKDMAGDEKLRQAAEQASTLEAHTAVYAALQAGIKNKDPQQLRRGFRLLGMSEEEVTAVVGDPNAAQKEPARLLSPQANQEWEEDEWIDDESDPEESPKGKGRKRRPTARLDTQTQQTIDALVQNSQALQAQVEELNQERTATQRKGRQQSLHQMIDTALDKDANLSKILEGKSEKSKGWIRRQAREAVARRAPDFPNFGDRTIQAGLTDLNDILKDVGIPGDEDEDDPGQEALELMGPGIGPSTLPGGVSGSHQSGKEPAAPDPKSPNFHLDFAARVLAKQRGKA